MNVDSEPQLDLASDKLPTNSRTCLAWNRAYQDVILETLKRIEHALSLNRKKQVHYIFTLCSLVCLGSNIVVV